MKKDTLFRIFGLLCFSFLCVPMTALGQVKATIVGTVTDPSGAVMPGVKITVTNTDTSATRTLETNAAGSYIAPELVPGPYEVKAEYKGFRVYSRTGIVLNVNDTVRVDIPMQVGEVTQSVTVSEATVIVQTESGEVSDLITGTQVTQLAVNTRNFFALAALTPGVSSDMPDTNLPIPVGSNSSIRFNGLRNDHNIWMIDGGENYDRGCGGCVTVMPSMDALAEFKIMTSNYGADFGIGSAGTVNMMLKSGVRDFHGTVYEFHREDGFDAADFFANKGGGRKPHLAYNIFGWNLGGPFYIPGKYNTEKNKTFFFFNQEWRKMREGRQVYANAIPEALRSGDFSSLATPIRVPSTNDPAMLAKYAAAGLTAGQPFPGNRIPNSLIDPNAVAFLGTGALPPPNATGDFYSGSRAVPIDVREEIVRVDQMVSDKLSIMAHFINDAVVQETMTTLWSGSTYPTIGTIFKNPGKSGVLRFTYTIGPTLLNEFAYNYNGNRIDLTPTGVFAKPSGMTIKEFFPSNRMSRLPTVNIGAPYGITYDPASWPWYNAADSQQVRDDVSWMVGKHALKFGGQFMRYRKNQDVFGTTQGNYSFDGTFTGNSFADFLTGFAKGYGELAIQDRGHWRTSTFSFYFTDSWRATSRLTLNLGARWEVIPHAYEVYDRMSNFYPALYDPAEAPIFNPDGSLDSTGPGFTTVPGVPLSDTPFYMNGIGLAGKGGTPRGLVDNHYNTVGPRIGFAYDLRGNGKTVLRGGIGSFYERIQGNDVYNGGPNPPWSFNPGVGNVYFSDPSVSNQTGLGAAVPIFPAYFYVLAKDYLIPASHQWSFGIQHELMPRAVLSVAYVGNQNSHQRIQRNINMPLLDNPLRDEVRRGARDVNTIRPFLGFSTIDYCENSTSGNYNSLQMNLRIDNYHGFTLQTAYTWAHAIDVQSGDFSGASNPYDLRFDRGSSDMDRRHVLTMNYVYDIPFLKTHPNPFVRQAFGGWQLSGITTFQTGLPVTVGYPGDNAGVGGAGTRPDLVGDPNTGPKTVDAWFNAAAFAAPPLLSFGNAGRNIVGGPGRNNWNVSIFKVFSGIPVGTKEGAQLQLRFEFFNTFNHTQFHYLFTTYGTGGFGGANSTWDPRIIQLGAKFSF